MPNDYQDSSVVVPVFTGINDVPQVPTATQAGNGSDIIARMNNLLGFLDTDIADLDSRITTLESSGGSQTNSANLTVQLNNTDDTLWITYIPYYSAFDSGSRNYTDASKLDNAQKIDLDNVRYFSIANGDVLDLKNFIEFNGIGIYFFLSGTFVGAYGDQSDTEQWDSAELSFTENSTPIGVKVLNFTNLLADNTLNEIMWNDSTNSTVYYDPSNAYSPNTNPFMALEVQSINFEFDFIITIG